MSKRGPSSGFPWFHALALLVAGCGRDAGGTDRDAGGEPPDADASQLPADAGAREDASLRDDAGSQDAGPDLDAGGAGPHWFANTEPVQLAASGAFGDAFAAAFAGLPDGIFPPVRVKDPFPGTLTYPRLDGTAHTADVTFVVRGNSSLQECAFPKLKLELAARSEDTGDLLYATKKLKIGSHCGEDEEVNGTIGRFCNELSAWREELVYRLARALGILTLQTRPARIVYSDSGSEAPITSPLERKAFLLEHIDELARRLGAVALKNPTSCGAETGATDPGDVLRVKFFHALVGNWDFQLGSLASGGCDALWNTEVLVHEGGAITLVPADFDLAAMVVGELRGAGAITEQNALEYARTNLLTNLEGESREDVLAMGEAYLAKRSELTALIDASPVDAEGKASAHLLLDAFFTALAE